MMFFKYRVLRYIIKQRRVTENELVQKFHFSEDKSETFGYWCDPDIDYLFIYAHKENSDFITYFEIKEKGREYVATVSREIFFALFAASVALVGAFLGALLPTLIHIVQSTPAPTP